MRSWLAWACGLGLLLACIPAPPQDPPSPPPPHEEVPPPPPVMLTGLPACAPSESRPFTVEHQFYIPISSQEAVSWETSPSDKWAFLVGDNPATGLYHWDGARWELHLAGEGFRPYLITGSSSTDVWFADLRGHLMHWNGVRLEPMDTGAIGSIARLHAVDAQNAWALAIGGSDFHGQLLHWHGGVWRVEADLTTPSTSWLVLGPDEVWVDSDPAVLRWRRGTLEFLLQEKRSPYARHLAGSGPDDVWVVSRAVLHHWDGTTLAPVPGAPRDIGRIDCAGPKDVWFYVDGKPGTRVHWDGSQFRTLPVPPPQPFTGGARPPPEDLYDVWAVSPTDVWVVGAHGTAAHYDGTQWTLTPTGFEYALRGVSGTSSTDVWAVGEFGTVLHWDGQAWSRVDTGVRTDFVDVFSGAGERAVVVGDEGLILRWTEDGWQRLPRAGWSLTAVWARGPGDIWASSTFGAALHWEQGRLVDASSAGEAFGPGQWAVWGLGQPGGVLAPGRWRDSAGVWHRLDVGDWEGSDQWRGAWQASSGHVWFALSTQQQWKRDIQRVVHTDGTCWSAQELVFTGLTNYPLDQLFAIHGAGEHDVWAVGSRGKLFHLRR